MPGKSCRNDDYDVIAFGGEYSHWACIQSKTMMLPGEAVHGARKAAANAELDGGQHFVEG
jgi:pyruvate/2-oxoglutarate dehydrogenase complex dihydrolipoamide dehydrogenase (E3) component